MKIRMTANAGLLINIADTNILIDSLHNNSAEPFCSVPTELLNSIIEGSGEFKHIDALIFTHTHKDHYDKQCVDSFMKNHTETVLICPSSDANPKDFLKCKINGVTAEACRLPHEGGQFSDVLNYGFFIYDDCESIFISGDSALRSEPIVSFLHGRKPDVAALCFPFITLSRGRKITDAIAPETVLAYHLPIRDKDVNHYAASCERVVKNGKLPYNVEILCQSNQQITIQPPNAALLSSARLSRK